MSECRLVVFLPRINPAAIKKEIQMEPRRVIYYLAVLFPSMITLCGCQDLVLHDTPSLLAPTFQRSEVVGIVAGFGTTFAAVPDLVAMLKRRSSAGMNPRMTAIMGAFQVLWVYYGFLILSRPVIGVCWQPGNVYRIGRTATAKSCLVLMDAHGRELARYGSW
jgi:hypothetical protein